LEHPFYQVSHVARYIKLVLLLFVLTSCGQPLVMKTTPRATSLTQPVPRPTSAAQLAAPSSAPVVPSAMPAPTALPATASPVPSATPAVIIRPQPVPAQTSQERWRAQELNRRPLDSAVQYAAPLGTPLYWYDPINGQSIEIGTLFGTFPATAQFTLRGSDQQAIEVPYQINMDYGLTAISDALIQRMQAAGYTERVEAYVLQSDAVTEIRSRSS